MITPDIACGIVRRHVKLWSRTSLSLNRSFGFSLAEHVRSAPSKQYISILGRASLAVLTGLLALAPIVRAGTNNPAAPVEIVVVASNLCRISIPSVSVVDREFIDSMSANSAADALNYISGTSVTEGSKRESNLRIRGLDNKRISFLLDGVPLSEPYYGSVDLNLISLWPAGKISVVKGPFSVLYGPNTLGGVMDVTTRRATANAVSAATELGPNDTYLLLASGALLGNGTCLSTAGSWNRSDGYDWRNGDETETRENSDYRRGSCMARVSFMPSLESEIAGTVVYEDAEYGIPPATDYYKPKYWRFKDWQRVMANVNGTTVLENGASLTGSAYYIGYRNTLDSFHDDSLSQLDWESAYDAYTCGAYMLGEWNASENHRLSASVDVRSEDERQQDDIGKEWIGHEQSTYSLGVEDLYSIAPGWSVVCGLGEDLLDKTDGDDVSAVTATAGLKYEYSKALLFYLAWANKTGFPTIRSLYGSGGNPDLEEETGRYTELGFTWMTFVELSGAIFRNDITDMIASTRDSSGTPSFANIGSATISGAELGLSKKFSLLSVSANYTLLDTEDDATGYPLDLNPKSQGNLRVKSAQWKGCAISIWGLAVSDSETAIENERVTASGYVVGNAQVEKQIAQALLYVKCENVFDKGYSPEPGYPMAGRTASAGIRVAW